MSSSLNSILRITETVEEAIRYAEIPGIQALLVLGFGLLLGLVLGRVTTRILQFVNVQELVEGTGTERWLQHMGTSTVRVIGRLVSLFIYVAAILYAILLIGAIRGEIFWALATAWLPHLFVAVLVLVIGIVVADKVEILVGERLQGIKLPEVSIIPAVVKYSIIFVALLVALGQVGVHTTALLVVLSVYVLGIVILGVVALKDLLSSGAAGLYLLLRQPFTIGDEVVVGDAAGVVQEVTVFVTIVEDDGRAYVVPNSRIVREGITRVTGTAEE